MSTELLSTPDKRTLDARIAQQCFDAYIEGNLRIPQNLVGGAIFLADTLMKDKLSNLPLFADYTLSREQVEKVKTIMNRAHAKHGVHVATEEGKEVVEATIRKGHENDILEGKEIGIVTEKRLAELWLDFKIATFWMISAFAGLKDSDEGYVDVENISKEELVEAAQKLQKYLQSHPESVRYITNVLDSFQETLRGPDGMRLAKLMKDTLAPPNEPLVQLSTERRSKYVAVHIEIIELLRKNYVRWRPWQSRGFDEFLKKMAGIERKNMDPMSYFIKVVGILMTPIRKRKK